MFKSFDVYTKADSMVQQKTTTGALITLVSSIFMFFLFMRIVLICSNRKHKKTANCFSVNTDISTKTKSEEERRGENGRRKRRRESLELEPREVCGNWERSGPGCRTAAFWWHPDYIARSGAFVPITVVSGISKREYSGDRELLFALHPNCFVIWVSFARVPSSRKACCTYTNIGIKNTAQNANNLALVVCGVQNAKPKSTQVLFSLSRSLSLSFSLSLE